MTTTSKSNFLNNVEDILSNIITNNESVVVKTEEGRVILLSEDDYNKLLIESNMFKA